MTRDEWIGSITDWDELIEFCNENGYDRYVDDIYDEYGKDDYLNSDLTSMARELTWEELRDTLDEIPTGYDFYRKDGYEWYGLDDYDFSQRRDEVLERLDDDEFFDADDNDEYDEEEPPISEYVDPEDLIPTEDEDINTSDLFAICSNQVNDITTNNESSDSDDSDNFDLFCIKVVGE